jgi:site-specific DNA-cytosine methylase
VEEEVRVLVACEFSGIVRDAFGARGHYAWSCALLPGERGGPHIQRDIRDVDMTEFDLCIAHPPCTHLCSSGARWWKSRRVEQAMAIAFVNHLWAHGPKKMAIENPIGVLSRPEHMGKPAQIIHPWQFGHGETKATCLWLRGLPPLQPTAVVEGREARVHRMRPGPDRWKERSRTYEGIAKAMAEQWG